MSSMQLESAHSEEQEACAEEVEEEVSAENSRTQENNPDANLQAQELPLTSKLGALLFVSSKPLNVQVLADAAKCSQEEVELALESLKESFSSDVHGIELVETADSWQFRTPATHRRVIERLIPPRARRLSRAAAETLAVIAYKQPVQKAEVEAIRGVDATPTLKTLLDAKLVRIVGRSDAAGHPAMYGTTQKFLEKFGLRDLSELPTVRELEEFADDPGEVCDEELSDGADAGESSVLEGESLKLVSQNGESEAN